MDQHDCVVVVKVETHRPVGVDFFKDVEEIQFKASMFERDFGDNHIVMTYPDSGALSADALHVAGGSDLFYA